MSTLDIELSDGFSSQGTCVILSRIKPHLKAFCMKNMPALRHYRNLAALLKLFKADHTIFLVELNSCTRVNY